MEFGLPEASEVGAWLLRVPHVADGGQSFVRDLAAMLRGLGLPLWRASLSILTKHPEVLWRTVRWHETEGLQVIERQHATLLDPFFTQSPIALLLQGAPSVRVRLASEEDPHFPICRDLKEQGGTDYYAQALPFSTGEISYVSWASREPGGFTDPTIRALDALTSSLARRLELESAYHATRTLLGVYLGRNASRRVLDGAFLRGGGTLTHSAIWFCDMRDFTVMSDRMAPGDVVKMLDAYFDLVAGAITRGGGDVLKFVGDAILAIFPTGPDPVAACANALRAAEESLEGIRELNERRAPQLPLAIGVALHVGEVMFGNIGSKERLDFTVISSSVNETCRLESLCKVLLTPLALSQAFVNALKAEDVVDLGEHALKGVSAKARVFTLARYRPTPAG